MPNPSLQNKPSTFLKIRLTAYITVILAGILALIILPQFTGHVPPDKIDAQEMSDFASRITAAIRQYHTRHGTPPPITNLWAELKRDDATGWIQKYSSVPANRFNGQTAIGTTASPTTGWVYTINDNNFSFQAVNAQGDGIHH